MKVIKHGIPPTNITTCPACGCHFTYIRKDMHENIEFGPEYMAFQTAKKIYHVECPDCGTEIPATIPVARTMEEQEERESHC